MGKKMIALVMAVMVVFNITGCSGSKDEGNIVYKGRYVEEEISHNGNISEFYTENNIPVFLDTLNFEKYTEDIENNRFTVSDPINYLSSYLSSNLENIALSSMVSSPMGEYFISYFDYSEGYNDMKYALITEEGQFSKLSLSFENYFYDYEYSCDGRLFAFGDETQSYGIYEIDAKRQKVNLLFSSENLIQTFDVVEDHVIAISDKEIFFYDYKNEMVIETPEAIQDFINEQGEVVRDICSGEKGAFYILSDKGLYRYVMGGNIVEQLIDGYSCKMANPAYRACSVICSTDNGFFVSYDDNTIMHYRYDADAVNEITSTLKVYSLNNNDTLSQIILEYKMKNPNVRVDYEVGMRKGITYDDALKNLTTAILSGDAPDVLLLDGLDIESYIEKNMLLDLSENESSWNPDNILLDNVARWSQSDKLYSVAAKFELFGIVGDGEILTNTDNIADIADFTESVRKEQGKLYPILMADMGRILDTALIGESERIFTDDGINAEYLTDFLKSCCRIYENNDLGTEGTLSMRYSLPRKYIGFSEYALMTLYDPSVSMTIGMVNGFEYALNIVTSFDGYENPNSTEFRFGLKNGSTAFLPVCNLGIMASTENREEAFDFIACAVSDNVQKTELGDGFPVNRNTLDNFYEKNKIKYNKEISFWYWNTDVTQESTVYSKWMDESEVSEFKKLLGSLDTPIYIDMITKQIIIDTGTECLEGHLTPEEAVEEITRQLDLRMKE